MRMIGTSAKTDDGLMMSVCLTVRLSVSWFLPDVSRWMESGETQFSLNEICNGSFPT